MGGYTPGPWVHVQSDNIILTHDGRRLLQWQARSLDVSTDERDANARLIAAAPSLVECLASSEELLSFYEGSASPEFDGAEPTVRINGEDFAGLLANIRAAISRATGEGE